MKFKFNISYENILTFPPLFVEVEADNLEKAIKIALTYTKNGSKVRSLAVEGNKISKIRSNWIRVYPKIEEI